MKRSHSKLTAAAGAACSALLVASLSVAGATSAFAADDSGTVSVTADGFSETMLNTGDYPGPDGETPAPGEPVSTNVGSVTLAPADGAAEPDTAGADLALMIQVTGTGLTAEMLNAEPAQNTDPGTRFWLGAPDGAPADSDFGSMPDATAGETFTSCGADSFCVQSSSDNSDDIAGLVAAAFTAPVVLPASIRLAAEGVTGDVDVTFSVVRTDTTDPVVYGSGTVTVTLINPAVDDDTPGDPNPAENPFPDVVPGNQHYDNIVWLKEHGITKPLDGYYHPLSPVNRGAMAAFLFRLTHPDVPSPACDETAFPDVNESDIFCGYISWAKDEGIAIGYADGSFHSQNPVTRGAMAAFLKRVATDEPTPVCTVRPFQDVAVDDLFCGVITWAVANDVTFGVGDGTNFGTTQSVTRQAMASFLHRIDTFMQQQSAE